MTVVALLVLLLASGAAGQPREVHRLRTPRGPRAHHGAPRTSAVTCGASPAVVRPLARAR